MKSSIEMSSLNIVIMAGGGGTRLWPLSRQHNPKQFLDLGTGKTLLQHTFERAVELASPADIYVATTEDYKERVAASLPELVPDNIFLEPARRDTAPAFAAAAVQLKLRHREHEPTIFMWSDHVFTNEPAFMEDLRKLPRLIEEHPDTVIILGHRPTSPETTLGYFEVGEQVAGYTDVYRVAAFKEKPDLATAEKYVAAGRYFWNMAYISLRPKYLLAELARHTPELAAGIAAYEQALQRADVQAAAKIYRELPKLAIDYALLEKTPRIVAATGDYGWSDVGGWAAVKDVFGVRGDHVPQGHHIHIDSQDNYIYNAADTQVSLIGMKNVIVVVTHDAVLVTSKEHAHKVKDVVARLEAEGQERYL